MLFNHEPSYVPDADSSFDLNTLGAGQAFDVWTGLIAPDAASPATLSDEATAFISDVILKNCDTNHPDKPSNCRVEVDVNAAAAVIAFSCPHLGVEDRYTAEEIAQRCQDHHAQETGRIVKHLSRVAVSVRTAQTPAEIKTKVTA